LVFTGGKGWARDGLASFRVTCGLSANLSLETAWVWSAGSVVGLGAVCSAGRIDAFSLAEALVLTSWWGWARD